MLQVAGVFAAGTPITLQLRWLHQFQFAGYYAALAQGYYAQEGLDVTIREADPLAPGPMEEVLAGRAQYGVGNAGLVAGYLQGKPVVALAALFQRSPNIWLARADSGIHSLQDLAAKRLMLTPSIENAEMLSVFVTEGVRPERLNLVPSTFNIDDLIEGRTDAFNAYSSNEPYLLARRGVKYTVIDPHEYGVDFYSDVLFTTADEVRLHPERAAAFRRASLAGWEYALAHPDEIVDLILQHYSKQKSREHLKFEAGAIRTLMQPDLIELGHMNPKRWKTIVDNMVSLGQVKESGDLGGFLYRPENPDDWRYLKEVAWILGITTLVAMLILVALSRFNAKLKREIADRVAAEQALQLSSAAKTRFLAAASHDLRQPLQAISLFHDALVRTGLSGEQKRISDYLAQSIHSLGDLLGALLDISRLDAGVVKPQPEEIAAEDLLAGIDAQFSPLGLTKNLRFLLYFPARGLMLHTDPKLLMSLLGNLIGNALKYTERGGILVAVRRRSKQALIQVWDTGIGIAPEHKASIFEEYFQVGNPERDRTKGLGLGLAIALRLAKLLGTEVVCHSRPGKGSVFEFRLPLSDQPPSAAAPGAPTPANASAWPALAGRKIVVVEDDFIVAKAIKLCLESLGMQVTDFDSAEDALASAGIDAADFYITDFRLPGLSGVEFLEAVQARAAKPIKAVVLTGDTSPDRIAITQSSAWPVLFKPVELSSLLTAIEAATAH